MLRRKKARTRLWYSPRGTENDEERGTTNESDKQHSSSDHLDVFVFSCSSDESDLYVEIDFGCFSVGGPGSCNVQVLGLFEQAPHGSPVTVTTQVFRERKGEHRDVD